MDLGEWLGPDRSARGSKVHFFIYHCPRLWRTLTCANHIYP